MRKPDSGIRWLRLLAEALAILASILVAFAIDAWWDEQNEQERQDRAIEQLTDEFYFVAGGLDILMEDYAGATDDPPGEGGAADLARTLQAMGTRPAPTRADSMIAGVMRVFELHIPTGRLTALIASGELALLESDELRASLADWETTARVLQQDLTDHRWMINEHVLPYLWDRISVRSVDISTGYHEELGAGPFAHDPVALFQDRSFENLVNEVLTTVESSQARLEEAQAHAEEILHLLEGGTLAELYGDEDATLAGASGEA